MKDYFVIKCYNDALSCGNVVFSTDSNVVFSTNSKEDAKAYAEIMDRNTGVGYKHVVLTAVKD